MAMVQADACEFPDIRLGAEPERQFTSDSGAATADSTISRFKFIRNRTEPRMIAQTGPEQVRVKLFVYLKPLCNGSSDCLDHAGDHVLLENSRKVLKKIKDFLILHVDRDQGEANLG